jgi:antibiotic biosynthesis monooxygenase (ABM) superfamily enzyme
MSYDPAAPQADRLSPPTKHQLAFMIWVAVVPTLTLLNVVLGPHLDDRSVGFRTVVVASVAVPIVIYGVMPHLHRVRFWLLTRLRR